MRYAKSIFSIMACPCTVRSKGEPIMDTVLSFLISVGIIVPLAFGLSPARSPLARFWVGR